MIKNTLYILLLAAVAYIFFSVFAPFNSSKSLGKVAAHYAEKVQEEVGSANLVTAVVVTYRGLDTLGEVSILFLSAAIVGFFLSVENLKNQTRMLKYESEILNTASQIIVPIMLLFGAYVFIHGHLSPGGGFQGGAIMASALVLMFLGQPKREIGHKLLGIIESVSGISFILLALAGILFASGFLDNSVLPHGTFGRLFSAGLIPLIYIFVGLKVGSELSSIALSLKDNQNEA